MGQALEKAAPRGGMPVSRLRRLHPMVKMLGLVCLFVLAVSLQTAVHGLLLALFIVGLSLAAGLNFTWYRLKFRTIFFFAVFIFLIQTLFTGEGSVLYHLAGKVAVTDTGLHNGAVTALRFWNIISASFLFVETTPGPQLAAALMQSGVPYRYAFLLVIAMRFIPVFGTEMNQVRNAQVARGLDLESGSVKKIWQMVKYTFLPLTVNALLRADVLAMSMEGRGFGMYSQRTYLHPIKFNRTDLVVGLLLVFITATLIII